MAETASPNPRTPMASNELRERPGVVATPRPVGQHVCTAQQQKADAIDQLPSIGEADVSPIDEVQKSETHKHERDDAGEKRLALSCGLHERRTLHVTPNT